MFIQYLLSNNNKLGFSALCNPNGGNLTKDVNLTH